MNLSAPSSCGLLHPAATIIDAESGQEWSGKYLCEAVDARVRDLGSLPAGLLALPVRATPGHVLTYLACLASGRPIALLDPSAEDRITAFVDAFSPTLVGGSPTPSLSASLGARGFRGVETATLGPMHVCDTAHAPPPHPELAVLLQTSGSSGTPKVVRLPRRAVLDNAQSISQALEITARDRAITSLPLYYSYGLSVLNSHLVAGATVVLTTSGPMDHSFWTAMQRHEVSSFAAVPVLYEQLRRSRWDPARSPSLRVLTQAGGRLGPDVVQAFAQRAQELGLRFHVMYGQTEATARISVMPAGETARKPDSVGLPLPVGRIRIVRPGTDEPAEEGEVVYEGPNVMFGYAETAADLARGDDQGMVLRTGDLGRLDGDGYLYLTGRLRRVAKVFGTLVNLDDVERRLGERSVAAAVLAGPPGVVVALADQEGPDRAAIVEVARELRLHPSGFAVRRVSQIPHLANGKPDYRGLASELGLDRLDL